MNLFVQGMRQGIEWIYQLTGDYGVAIVLITIVIRLFLIPLNIQQRKQMKKQQEISREMERLKAKYRNDPQKMNRELQKLYQEKGVGTAGCLVSLIQFPIMMCLYYGIRLTAAAGTATILLPWVSSLLVRDQSFILPSATLIVQFLPQIYPYLNRFKVLGLQKMSPSMMVTMFLMNSMFVFVIPSGVELFYFVSGAFSAAEQWIVNCAAVNRVKQTA